MRSTMDPRVVMGAACRGDEAVEVVVAGDLVGDLLGDSATSRRLRAVLSVGGLLWLA